MKEFILYKVIPLFILAIFICVMKSGEYLKQSFTEEDDVMHYVELVSTEIDNGHWSEAKTNISNVKDAFEIVKKRIQFSVERNELYEMESSINRAIGFVSARDVGGAKAELEEIKFTWEGLGK
ncbi:uncharacterized protein DUF4363 [Cytobacillus horneckiae]|uniref:DUF4363 family protein n=1 Tax=Cytobacillus horneckiae TaxID=549687 RepID=UPI0019CFBFB9|nr:DUF4363 family protein [Cytobacillus horneckiae]MBN6886962.1 DUF4363 family protein [Cytobacillus horneckiae]